MSLFSHAREEQERQQKTMPEALPPPALKWNRTQAYYLGPVLREIYTAEWDGVTIIAVITNRTERAISAMIGSCQWYSTIEPLALYLRAKKAVNT